MAYDDLIRPIHVFAVRTRRLDLIFPRKFSRANGNQRRVPTSNTKNEFNGCDRLFGMAESKGAGEADFRTALLYRLIGR